MRTKNQNSDRHGQNANSTARGICIRHLHNPHKTQWSVQIITRPLRTQDQLPEAIGGLPHYKAAGVPASVNWGRKGDGELIMPDASFIVEGYNEIITWRKNSFLVPCRKTGRDFIDQITKHIHDWNNGTEMQHIA